VDIEPQHLFKMAEGMVRRAEGNEKNFEHL
jgi:hypothetical protein